MDAGQIAAFAELRQAWEVLEHLSKRYVVKERKGMNRFREELCDRIARTPDDAIRKREERDAKDRATGESNMAIFRQKYGREPTFYDSMSGRYPVQEEPGPKS